MQAAKRARTPENHGKDILSGAMVAVVFLEQVRDLIGLRPVGWRELRHDTVNLARGIIGPIGEPIITTLLKQYCSQLHSKYVSLHP